MEYKYDVFISYSHKDKDVALKICQSFDEEDIFYFIHRQGISGGAAFFEIIAKAITESKLFLFLASNNSYNSKYAKDEVFFAHEQKDKATILPYIIDDTELPLEYKLIFSGINRRSVSEHPISTVLTNDVLFLLKKKRKIKLPISSKELVFSQNDVDSFVDVILGFGGKDFSYIEAIKYWKKNDPDKARRETSEIEYLSMMIKHREILLFGEIDDLSANFAQLLLLYYDRIDNKKIKMRINSFGGKVFAGLGLYDTMSFMSSPISTIGEGFVAGMAVVILSAGTKGRRIADNDCQFVLSTPMQSTTIDLASNEHNNIETVTKLEKECSCILSEVTGRTYESVLHDCKTQLAMTSQNAVEYGLVDQIVSKRV